MSDQQSRMWWPFALGVENNLSEDEKARVAFLEEATHQGCRAFVQQSDCGAVAADGRECYLIWRGRHRTELLLIDAGKVVAKKVFADPGPTSAFRHAAAEGVTWLRGDLGTASDGRKKDSERFV